MKSLLCLAAVAGVVFLAKNLVADYSEAANDPRVTFYGDGQMKNSTVFEDGVRSGPSEQWHSGGAQEWTGSYEDGLREGAWTFWNEDGSIDRERSGSYRAGKRVE